MTESSIGPFICELRKEKGLTQKELAAQLHITDKAVSKWERGLSCPDISLLASLADILGVTTGELLNGQRCGTVSSDIEQSIDAAFVYAEKSVKGKVLSFQNKWAIFFSLLLLLGMVVCSICDIAISKKFTWSLYPISSILFAWVVLIPFVRHGRDGIPASLAALSISVIPFLYVINALIDGPSILPIGIPVSLFSILYLWCVYLLFRKMKARGLLAGGVSCIVLIPLCLAINSVVSKFCSAPILDAWDHVSFAVILVIAAALIIMDRMRPANGS